MAEPRYAVRVAPQVVAFLRALAPASRRRLRLALHALEQGRGEFKALEGRLDGYHRVRVGAFRVVIRFGALPRARPAIFCVFAEHRSLVYLLLEDLLTRGLRKAERPP
jgi:mRNA-degrading endonuclease RelE of RelBE toxin-antitoxin system